MAAVITYNVTKREIVYIAFIKVYEQISFWVSIFVAMIAIEGNICIITSLYNKYRDRNIMKKGEFLLEIGTEKFWRYQELL